MTGYYVASEKYAADNYIGKVVDHCKILFKDYSKISPYVVSRVGELVGNYEYYMEHDNGKYKFCRRNINTKEETVVLDPDSFRGIRGRNPEFGTMKVDKNNRYFAYLIDPLGKERFDAFIVDLETGEDISRVSNVCNIEWSPDGKYLYYTKRDTILRPNRLYVHDLSNPTGEDVLLYEETDESFFLDVYHSKDWKYIIINSNSKDTSEIRLIDTQNPVSTPKVVHQRQKGKEVYMDHLGEYFYCVTNSNTHSNYSIQRFKSEDMADPERYQTIVSTDDDTSIHDIDLLRKYLVLYKFKNAELSVELMDLDTLNKVDIPLPSRIGDILPGVNMNPDGLSFKFTYSNIIHSGTCYEYRFGNNELKKIFVDEPFDESYEFNEKDYVIKRIWVPSGEVKVPMTIVHKVGLEMDGGNHTVLSAYGAYGTPFNIGFDPFNIPLLKRGFVIAIAHVRGGNELGRKWYLDGKLNNKVNSFVDFVNCARYLIGEKYTSSEFMAARVSSAGGLIAGYVANEYPELFKCMIMHAPFLDLYQTMNNKDLPLTIHEGDEWGDITDESQFKNILSYDPYQNISKQRYPAMLIRSSVDDDRVPVTNSIRYVAKLRRNKTPDSGDIVLCLSDEPGHFGSNENIRSCCEDAAFLFHQFNIIPEDFHPELILDKLDKIKLKKSLDFDFSNFQVTEECLPD